MRKKKILYALTLAWAMVILFSLTVMNPPQCPAEYAQSQISSSGCVIGANIGLGLTAIFVILPLTIVVVAGWIIVWRRK